MNSWYMQNSKLHCKISKIPKSNSAWVKIPLAKSQNRLVSCQEKCKFAAAEALAVNEMTCIRHFHTVWPINVRFQSPLCKLRVG